MTKDEIRTGILLGRNVKLDLKKEHYEDREIVELLITNHKYIHFKKISGVFKNDENLVRKMIEVNWESFNYASNRLKRDEDFILSLLPKNYGLLEYVDKKLLSKEDFIYKLLKFPNTFYFLNEEDKNKDCYLDAAIKNKQSKIIFSLDTEYVKNTEKMTALLIKMDDNGLFDKEVSHLFSKMLNMKILLNEDYKEIIEKNFSEEDKKRLKEKVLNADIKNLLRYISKNKIIEEINITNKQSKKIKF